MADVHAVFGTLLALGITFPGMLTAWWLLFPTRVALAQSQIHASPWRCFWFGAGVTLLVSLPITILLALPMGLAKLLGILLLFATLAYGSLGAAGLAAEMGARLIERTHGNPSPAGAFLRAAVALELAAAFPIIGWFIFMPLTVITSIGAASSALRQKLPQPSPPSPAETATSQA